MEILGLPVDVWKRWGVVIGLYLFATWSPLILPAIVSAFQWRTLNRKFLFCLVVSMLTYGFLLLIFLLVWIPVYTYGLYFSPHFRDMDYFSRDSGWIGALHQWFLNVLDFVYSQPYLLSAAAIFVAAVLVTWWLRKRWNKVCEAIA